MPDITMCASDKCTARKTCYRNPESGTKPNPYQQAWFVNPPKGHDECDYYWERK